MTSLKTKKIFVLRYLHVCVDFLRAMFGHWGVVGSNSHLHAAVELAY